MLKINEKRLAKFKIQGAIIPAYGGSWRVCYDGKHRMVPSVGGITLNFKVGDLANMYVSDHLEPGVSSSMEPDITGKNYSVRNMGYNSFSCVGNEAKIVGGKAKGKKGVVTGHHGGCEHVIIDFDDKTLEQLTYEDQIMITSYGVGLEIEGHEDIAIFSMAPNLFKKMGVKESGKKIEVAVACMVPAVVMGSGIGGSQPFKGDYDIQTSDVKTNKKYGLDKLRLGDIVAIIDHDSTQGWSYCQGAVSIGVVIHGDSHVSGHGPGCQTLMTSKVGNIVPKLSPNANIGNYLKIGRYRRKATSS